MNDTHQTTWRDFPGFYASPVIQSLAFVPRWTVSAVKEDEKRSTNKMPLDMRGLLDEGVIRGAYERDETCLATLDEILRRIPDVANHAFYLDAQVDGYIVIDIEKTCPVEVSARLLQLPFLYGELSMSGLGYHLVMPLPTNMSEYEIALTKRVLREEHGYYELLLEHYVTFTRSPIPAEHFERARRLAPGGAQWDDVYAELASQATENISASIEIDELKPEIPFEDAILDIICRQPYKRTLADFHHDHSRYEFGLMGYLYNRLAPVVEETVIGERHDYTESERAWLIYLAAVEILEHRDKHDELRNGLPLLLNTASSIVADRLSRKEAQQDTTE